MIHANLGASSTNRWMNCTASPSLIEQVPAPLKDRSSIFAEEGSAAHFLAETMLTMWGRTRFDSDALDPLEIDWKGTLIARPADPTLKNQWNTEDDYAFYGKNPIFNETAVDPISHAHPTNQFAVNEEMEQAVFLYIETIKGFYESAVDPSLQVETMVRPIPTYNDSVFGTADAIVTDAVGGEVWVIDFKYGKGVKVTAPFNTQAMFYAAGALEGSGHTWIVDDRVHVVIVQPRVEFADGTSISHWTTTATEIYKWARNDLQLAVQDTSDESRRKYEAGNYCRWCPAASLCPLLQAQALETAQAAFTDDLDLLPYSDAGTVELILPRADDDPALSQAMKIAAVLENWTKKVRELADYRQRVGGKIPGFKMVRKRTNRRWINEQQTTQTLRAATDREQMEEAFTSKLKSPTQMEKAGFDKDLVDTLTEKPEGGLTLVSDTDPRKEASTAISAFSDLPEDWK